ncbi:ABC transporter permease [Paraclostridium bifermentans]|uniref:ABC transporter permease n=1 Tax=Paraclostridium bifermentans TaxID=1490 RepID=UPI00359C9DDC
MIDLIKFEIYKIFSRKIVLVLILASVIISIMPTINEYTEVKEKDLSYSRIKEIGKDYEGQVITRKQMDEFEKNGRDIRTRYNKGEKISDAEKIPTFFMIDYHINLNPDYVINGSKYKYKGIEKEIDRMEKDGETNTYEYKNIKYVKDLIDKREAPKYYFKFGWEQATEFVKTPIFIAILIIVSVSTIFSNDYQSNTIPIVLSSKNGKKKLTWAKVIAGLTFSTTTFLIINGIQVLILALHKFDGWDVPLNFFFMYERTPYNINISTFYILGLLVSFIGVILFTLIVMLISLISKNNLTAFAISIAALLGPEFISKVMPTYTSSRIFREMNIYNLMRPIATFGDISTYNIFSNPTLYLNILLTIGVISIPIVLYLINRIGKKQVI